MKVFRIGLPVLGLMVLITLLLGAAIGPALAAKTSSGPVKPSSDMAVANQQAGQVLDIIVKINRLEDALNLVDQLYATSQKDSAESPTMLLRGMLQGTAWIDASRPIVIGIEIQDPRPIMAAIVPFVEPNPSFMNSSGAEAGPGYYLIPLPPGQPKAISENTQKELAGAVQVPGNMSVTIDLALGRIMKTRHGQIREKLRQMNTLPNARKMAEAGFTPETQTKMLNTAAQIRKLSFGVNLDRSEIGTLFEFVAETGTQLSQILATKGNQASLQGYAATHQINFRSGEYDIEGLMGIFMTVFGEVYRTMGIDMQGMTEIFSHFTGEMAGGMSYRSDGIEFEMIAVMKDAVKSADFIEKTYLPWLESYSRTAGKMLEKQSGEKIGPLYVRTGGSQVAGYRVVGEKFQMPMMPGRDTPMHPMTTYEVRMTMVGDKFIMAPDDKRIGQLIRASKTMKKTPAGGPLMTANLDMGSYIDGIMWMMSGMEKTIGTLPKTGRVTVTADMENGRAYARTSIPTKDISTLMVYFAELKSAAKKSGEENSKKTKDQEAGADKKEPAPRAETDPEFWIDKGALAATYGADQAAIKYFKKALILDPQRSDAYFQMGISYGELGKFAEAIEAIDKAISIGPQRGIYFYGRGRVFLLSGEADLAMEDFRMAADLGSGDAIKYLKRTNGEWPQ